MTFMGQLIWFHKRLYGPSFESLPVSPRVFLVCSHQPEDPFRISCKLQMDNLYIAQLGDKSLKLDPRAVFIVQSAPGVPVYIWQGGNVPQRNMPLYMAEAHRYIKVLQKNERASDQVIVCAQGSEDEHFWSLFFGNQQRPPLPKLYGNVVQWNLNLIDVSI